MKMLCVTLLATIVAGCATTQPLPKEILTPVSVSCIKTVPVKPEFVTHNYLKSLNVTDYPLQITAEYLKYESYAGELEATLSGCK